jgi:hypothetical protein
VQGHFLVSKSCVASLPPRQRCGQPGSGGCWNASAKTLRVLLGSQLLNRTGPQALPPEVDSLQTRRDTISVAGT